MPTAHPVLVHLAQECAETIVAVTKLDLHGPTPTVGTITYNNLADLADEVGDILAMVQRAVALGLIDPQRIAARQAEKSATLREMYPK